MKLTAAQMVWNWKQLKTKRLWILAIFFCPLWGRIPYLWPEQKRIWIARPTEIGVLSAILIEQVKIATFNFHYKTGSLFEHLFLSGKVLTNFQWLVKLGEFCTKLMFQWSPHRLYFSEKWRCDELLVLIPWTTGRKILKSQQLFPLRPLRLVSFIRLCVDLSCF